RERVEQEAELRALLVAADAEELEDARLERGLVDPERAAAELVAVADQVVGERERVPRVLVEAVLPLPCRPREGMVDGAPALLLVAPLEHREVGDPRPRERRVVGEAELAAEAAAERAQHTRGHGPGVGGEEERLPRLRRERPARISARDTDKADGSGLREDPELRAAGRFGRVLELEAEAQVGLVAAE